MSYIYAAIWNAEPTTSQDLFYLSADVDLIVNV